MSSETPAPPEYVTRNQEIVEDLHSDYQHIIIARDPDYGHVLYLDGDMQIAESDAAYHRAVADPIIQAGLMGRVLILGGGDGGVLKAAVHAGAIEATLVDIDAKVIELARTYLPGLCEEAFDSPNAHVVIDDAFTWLDGAGAYDAIVYDLTMEPVRDNQSRLAFIEETVSRAAAGLKSEGMLTMQCCSEHEPELRDEIYQALTRHFTAVSQRPVVVPSYHERWIFGSARYPRRS